MKKASIKTGLLASSMLLPAILAAPALFATSASAQETTEVVVTGSRIKTKNLTSASPITSITSADVKASGATRTEDLVNTLPQVFASNGAFYSNGATGTATVNLRGLGVSRTLVLINGARMGPGSPVEPAPDINQIPAALIERVDILTGGASAVYGSDAMAGVVNFVMKKNFQGVELNVNTSAYQHKNDGPYGQVVQDNGFDVPEENVLDGKATDITIVAGSNFADDKGNATVYLSYRTIEALLQSERDYSACTLLDYETCGGSSTSFPGRFRAANQTTGAPTGPNYSPVASGGFGAYTGPYNYGPLNYYQRPDEKYAFGAFVTYDINEKTHFGAEISLNDDHSVGQIAPSGIFYGTWEINCGNPLLVGNQASSLGCSSADISADTNKLVAIGRRLVESGGRQYDMRHTAYRLRTTLDGELNDNWSYSLSAQYATTDYKQVNQNQFINTRIDRALHVDAATGKCQSVVDGTDPDCVPLNIFSLGGVTQEALNYISATGVSWGNVTEQVVTGSMSGDLTSYGFKSPWANDGVKVSIGTEYRRETLKLDADENLKGGLLAGSGGKTSPVSGAYDVKEIFGEAVVPLVSDAAWAKNLSLELGYRTSDYSTSGSVTSWKAMVQYQPFDDLKFRAGKQRAVRGPNILELYTPTTVQLTDYADPCASDNPGVIAPAATAAQCAYTGVTAAMYGTLETSTAGQYNYLAGGNTSLKPETGNTLTVGFVYTPSYAKGFNVSVDYFDIEIEDRIGTIGAQTILDGALTGDPFYTSKIHRDAGGSLWLSDNGYVINTLYNTGGLRTSGFDINANFSRELPVGRLGMNYTGTILNNLERQATPTADWVDDAGLFDGDAGYPNPKYRHKIKTTWYTPINLDASLTWRYYGSVENSGNVDAAASSIEAYNYLDLYLSYDLNEMYKLHLGINNLMDKDPPIVPSSSGTNGNTYPQNYDPLGRYIFGGIKVKF